MACCRTVLVMLVFCIFFILPVVFSLAISSITVPYDAPVGYLITTVDTNGDDVMLRHVDDASKVFTLSKEGRLTLNYPLQTLLHKGRTAVVIVVQHGHGFSEWEEVINVHITGVNNKLHFTESFCIGSVSENSAIGSPVHGLEDLSIWRGDAQVLQVHVSGVGSDLFSTEISSIDGRIKIFTNEILDREEVSSYSLHLTIAGDGPNPETADADILINVQDENDNFPEFFQTENEFSIALSSVAGTEAGSVQARDQDVGDNGEVSYFLITESPFFAVNALTGVIYVKEMVKEQGTYHLYLAAQDNGDPSLSSKLAAHVAVTVEPHSHTGLVPYGDDIVYPMEQMVEFKQARSKRDVADSLAFEVNEHADVGTIIGSVTDYPRPTDKFETDSVLFAVDAMTGNISLQTTLNYEEEALYDFTVRVLNISNPASVQDVQISVSVVDESDPPYWTIEISPFIAVVPSNAPQNAPVYQLTAADEDQDADIRYYLRTGDGFYVDEITGQIKTTRGFRYTEDDAPYILSVYAEDINSLSQDDIFRQVNGVVTIFVDQHPPQFAEDPYEVSVPEGVPQFEVVTVRAISFDNQRLRYALLPPPQGTPRHNIGEFSGVIELAESLDREVLGNYFLEVQATEQGGDELSSVVRVNVKVADSNDNDPTFSQAAYSFDGVREDISLNEAIGSVQAIDPDEGDNGKVYYSLSGEDASYFRVDENGNLYANRTLDFDKRYESYYFVLEASDGGTPSRSSTASVRVRVIATSDEYPVFAPDRYTYYVDETAGADYSIGTVYASDADGETITFTLIEDSGGRFTVEGDTESNNKGVIKLTSRAENNLPDSAYTVVVAATDTKGSQETVEVRIIVNDINDNAPQFLDCDTYEPHVIDGQQVTPGQEPLVLQVNATDRDRGSNAEITYRLLWEGTGDNPFVIDSETGEIKLSFGPDREMFPSYRVTAVATDKARDPSTGLCTFTIIVDDVNDSRPRFRRNQYEVTVAANSPLGSTVLTVEAEDADLNSVITYSLARNEYFNINPGTGEVIVKSSLLPLSDSAPWSGLVTASDGKLQSQQTLNIRVVDSTDDEPVFDPYENPITIPENFSTAAGENVIGEFTARIQTVGGDSRVSYSLLRGARPETNFPVKFTLNNDEGFTKATVILSDRLDYETVQEIELEIVAEGVVGSLPGSTKLKIILEDVNDNPPRFPLVNFDATVKENAPPGTSVAHVVAEDGDSSEEFRTMRYRIDQSDENRDWENFEINENTGEITTTVEFDREEVKTYLINVIAENVIPLAEGTQEPNRAQTSVRIDVLDENDNEPIFAEDSYSATVPEDIGLGGMVIRVEATDKDEDSTLRYLITNGNTNGVFEVDPDSGVISVAVGLDFEKVQEYTLEYSANDGLKSASTIINITVTDVNDKRPEFDELLYTTSVLEEDSSNIPRDLLQVNAVDGDTSATPVVYSLEGTGAGDIFTISPTTGQIRINEKLDREEQPVYNLVAVARDENGQGLAGYTTVVVNVDDINDWAPRFPEVEYTGSVPENSPLGTTVMEVIAEDRDDPNTDNGRLTYAIEPLPDDPNDGMDLFAIDPATGVVTTKVPGSQLDAEEQDTYVIQVSATDGTDTAVTTATITIEDVNDNRPIFNPTVYEVTIPETLELGATAVEVMATDLDISGRDDIEFSIINGNTDDVFGIYTDTPTLQGLIYPQKVLDYESDPIVYTLQVEVNDGMFSDTATVTISLTDENEPPVFNPSLYEVTVLEDIPPGTLLETVSATDEDRNSPNNVFEYFVDPASDPDGLFIMVGDQLQVAPNKNLDRETVDSHTVNILATDGGTPPLSGTAVVQITVGDVDDTAPRFKEDYKGYVHENDTKVQWVAVVHAVDDDLTELPPKFSYHIPSDQLGNEFFAGLENTGNNSYTVEKRPLVIIDREENPSFDLIIRITDENSNTGDNILPIEVLDLNDNPHHPVTKDMLVYAFEGSVPLPGAVPNIGIGFVGVNDLDILEDKTYRVVEGASKYINVDTDSGLVEIAEGTPATDDGDPYTLRIEVDDGGKYPTVTSVVEITIKEIPREAVFKSGSLRLSGVTPEEFISPRNGASQLDRLTKLLSDITGAKEENIDVFTILPVEGNDEAVDVRYSAHGSPYYPADQLNRDAESNVQLIEETLGVTVEAIYIDECSSAECEADCSNVLEIDPQPVIIDALDASVVGINSYIAPFCGCAARERDVGTCVGHYCHNGGTCEDSFSGPRCMCGDGFDGSSCQGTTRSFRNGGYALLPTLKQCSETRTSVEFVTEKSSGILFYNGPTSKEGTSDYILLQLRNGKPLLNIDLGGGTETLEVMNSPALNDGKWHKVDIFRNNFVVELVIDDCRTATLSEDHISSSSQRDSCSGNLTLPEGDIVFQSNEPLQLGGVSPNFEYPDNLGLDSADSFEGCIRNLDQDSTLYDLHDVTDVANSEPGCPQAELCDPDCENGVCDADFFEAKCICNPGWTGEGCDEELGPYDFLDGSYVEYSLRSGLVLTERESDYKIMVRTRMKTGLIWQITNENTFEHITMELVNGYLMSSWHLGDDTVSVTLDKYPLDNGEWHHIAFYRYDNYVQVKVDGGGGVRQVENRDSTFRALLVDRESLIVGAELEYGVDVTNDFVGCVKDPRILDYYLGVTEQTDWATPTFAAVEEGCRTDGCLGNDCSVPFVCVDIWRAFECRCPLGLSPLDGTCVDIEDCENNPCLNGGICREAFRGYNCTCPKNFYGQNCEIERERVVLTIGPSGIIPIVACLLFLLLLLLLFIIYKRTEDKKNALAFAVDPEDDIRENFINYDEEGGEEDQTAFDVSTLRKPVEPSPIIARPVIPLEEVPRRAIPRDGVNVGDFLEERLGDTDDDPSAPPYDTLHTYDYEGEGSTAGSLSSLNSSSSDGSQDYDYLNDLGPPFKRLADMYGGVE